MLGLCIRCGLLLTLGCLQVSGAQEPSGKPEVPTPKTVQSSIPLPKYSPADSEPKKPGREPETVADLSALATSVAKYISVAGRQPKSCTVLLQISHCRTAIPRHMECSLRTRFRVS